MKGSIRFGLFCFLSFFCFTIGWSQITITQQPVNPNNRCEGQDFTFSTDATGTTNITFQWQKYNTSTSLFENLSDGGPYSGTTTKNLLISNVQFAQAGDYRCEVAGDAAATVYCNIGTLTVNAVPSAPLVNNGSLCGSGQVTVSASGASDGNFIWYGSNGMSEPIPGENNSIFLTPSIGTTTTYFVSIVNAFCESALVPVDAIINPLPETPVVTNATNDGCSTQALTLQAFSPGSGIYKWYETPAATFAPYSTIAGELVTEELSASKTFYVAFSDGTCESLRAAVTATVTNPGPGFLDETFLPAGNSDGNFSAIDDVEIQSDGKFVLNYFETEGTEYMICRLLADGTLDPSFLQRQRSLFIGGRPDVVALQSDGKIISGGRFTSITGIGAAGRIVRLNTDGSWDNTFNSSSAGFNGRVSAIDIQSDNQIVVGGSFTAYNSTAANRIVRVNESNGSIDPSFDTGTGFDTNVNRILIRPDGKILVSGNFSSYNGASVQAIVLLSANGILDASFNPPPLTSVGEMALQSDGKILIQSNAGFLRLNADGSQDFTFSIGSGFDAAVNKVFIESSGKILVAGDFQNFNGVTRYFVARLNPNGSLDGYFNTGLGSNTWCYDILPAGPDLVFVAGYFDTWNQNPQNGIAKINNACIQVPKGFDASTCTSSISLTACGGFDGDYRWYTTPSGGTAISGETSSVLNITNLTATTTYYVSLNDGICESVRVPVIATLVPGGSVAPSATGSAICGPGSVTLVATGGTDGQYRWYTTAVGGSPIAGQVNGTYVSPSLTASTDYYVAIDNGICESSRTEVAAIINLIPSAPVVTSTVAITNGQIDLCPTISATLTAPTGFTAYNWSTGSIDFTTTVSLPGVVTLAVTDNNGCISAPWSATVNLRTCAPTFAPATPQVIPIAGQLTIDVTASISSILPIVPSSLRVVVPPSSGASAGFSSTGELQIDYAGLSFAGTDVLTIEVCNIAGECSQQVITIEVVGDIIVFNGVSPNGDGLNDYFLIRYIESLPTTRNNKVSIFSRWGDLVFDIEDYDNATRVFTGLSNSGQELPSGIYFYKIAIAGGENAREGYLSLKR